MDTPSSPAPGREHDTASWWYLIHTKLYRYRALLRKYWWLVLFTTCAGLAIGAWKMAHQQVVYVSTGRMMVSGKINLPEGATYTEEMNLFISTQRELMQDEAVRQRAEALVRGAHPELAATPIDLMVAPLPQTSIFILTATGAEPTYPQKFLDAIMHEYIATRREMRTQKSEDAESSIEDEIARVQGDVRKEEEKLITFQRENNVGFLEQGGNSAGAYLAKLNTQLAELKNEAQLLDLFQVDQKMARDESRRATNKDNNKDAAGGDPRAASRADMEYTRARQQIEVLRTERTEYAKDLRPKHPIIVDLDRQIAQQQQLIDVFRKQSTEDLERRREGTRLEIQNLEKTIQEWETKALDLSGRLAEYNTIQAGLSRKRSQLESLSRSKGNVEINRNVDQEVVSIRQRASAAQPQKPGVPRTIGTAVALGLLVGLLCLVLIDQLDDRVASYTEFQSHFRDRVFAQIPHSPADGETGAPAILMPEDERHAFAEAFRSLRSSIIFLPVEGPRPKVILVTSAVPNEGKSTVAMNFAITLALAGSRVLLVDGDLRRGELHRSFGLSNESGLGDVLAGHEDLQDAMQLTLVPGLTLLSRGRGVPNPGELYLGKSADDFLKAVHADFDYTILDSSPVMAADDTTSLAPKADAAVFVFRFTSSSTRASRKALELLRERQTNIIGIVCNDVSEAMQEYYYYRYPDYYASATKSDRANV
ncbi:MAG: polysaccharide biosynthesis tyrosine autokinase [Chthoniobacter sp.]|uniref:polysaccharide biosynthesis tyrosine autokinase n=1 Tax=Chthoniobacter sp. TaxID=2510640 RepID=UPI0032A1C0D2